MNDRIKLLWEEAAKTTQGDSWEEQTKFMERYTELIVRECARRVDYWESRQGEHTEDLLKHFGVTK
jgi:hypothetical protein